MDWDFRANPVYAHDRFRIVCGDCLAVLPTEPAESVDCVVTSPPFWRVRDFGGGIGMEDDLNEYLERLIAVFAAVRRVLKPTGTVWVEFGDAYNNGGIGGKRNRLGIGSGPNQESARQTKIVVPYPRKSMLGVPWRFALRMIDDGWCLRNVVCWARPAPLPEAVFDRLTRAWTPVFMFAKGERYYFDLDSIRVPQVTGEATMTWMDAVRAKLDGMVERPKGYVGNPNGRNPGDVWMIPPDVVDAAGADGEEHPARFPEALVALCLIAGCPPQVCSACGAPPLPSRRGLEPSCGCMAPAMPGLVLDPFAGSGTTAAVALRLGYRALALDIHPGYCEAARRRCMLEASKVPISFAGTARKERLTKARALSMIEEVEP